MVGSTNRNDGGFTLTELIIVLTLLGIVLSISYAALIAIYKGREVSDRQASFAREVSAPLGIIEKVLTQATTVEAANANSMTVLTDRDNDNVLERHVVQVTSAGTLRHETWLTNAARINTTKTYDVTWTEHNVNIREGQGLFEYFGEDEDGDGARDPLIGVFDPRDVEIVDIVIVVEYDGRQFSDSRTAFMRNR